MLFNNRGGVATAVDTWDAKAHAYLHNRVRAECMQVSYIDTRGRNAVGSSHVVQRCPAPYPPYEMWAIAADETLRDGAWPRDSRRTERLLFHDHRDAITRAATNLPPRCRTRVFNFFFFHPPTVGWLAFYSAGRTTITSASRPSAGLSRT